MTASCACIWRRASASAWPHPRRRWRSRHRLAAPARVRSARGRDHGEGGTRPGIQAVDHAQKLLAGQRTAEVVALGEVAPELLQAPERDLVLDALRHHLQAQVV